MKPFNFHIFRSSLAVVIIAASMTMALSSCSDDDDSKQIIVEDVTVKSDPDNALRYPVTVTTSADCEVSLTYWPADNPDLQRTTPVATTASSTANIVINFVKGSTDYVFAVNVNGQRAKGQYPFTTSAVPPEVPKYNVIVDNGGAPADGYIMQWQATKPGWLTFCDMDGQVVWYEKFDLAIRVAQYCPENQQICLLTGFRDGVNSKNFQRLATRIITVDLNGNRLVDWECSPSNVDYAHHDIKFTPDGNLIMVCNTIKKFDLTEFGLGNDTEVWGDGFAIITPEMEMVREWNNFDELTPFNCDTVIKEKGAVKDFLHANSVNWDKDGNYYMTFNRINQLWKIDSKTGKVIYRVGPGGNVKLDEAGFCSGIHAAVPLAPDRVLVLDNGSDRGYSSAVIYEVNPTNMTAEVTMNVDFPKEYFSSDRSNAQLICDDKILMFGSTLGRANVFTDLKGNVLKVISRTGISYRSYYYKDI